MAVVNAPKPLTGAQKAAVVMMTLGEEHSSKLMRYLDEVEIERIAREVAAMGKVPAEVGESVLLEFHEMAMVSEHVGAGGVDYARRLLSKSLGPDSSRRILERVIRSFATRAGFQTLEKASPQQLSKFILGEHPQTIALVLAHLDTGSAAQIVSQLPDDMRADVLVRMASIDDVTPEVIGRISYIIDQRLKSLGGASREQHGGVRSVAELFNRLDRSISQGTLERIESQSPDLAVQIRNLMFVFEDLATVEDNGIRELASRADKKTLTVALKGASEEIRDRFFGNMSKRAADLIREEMEVLGAVRLRDVEKAQQEIVAIARKLEEEGLITTGAGAGEPYVV
ncbi:MAG: flagellar motor switch protein FliG [Vicinamibacterales bacterium]